MTECTQSSFEFQPHFRRSVTARFDGGIVTSDAGSLLLREADRRIRLLERFAACFEDHRRADRIEHPVSQLLAQRIYGLALGYEDLNDPDHLRRDPLLAVLAGKSDLEGRQRRRAADRGMALAGKSTLNRLELTAAEIDEHERYKKIRYDQVAVDSLLVDLFLEAHEEQFSLFSDRMSTATMRANQLRLYFSAMAYALVQALRRIGLRGTEWARAQAGTIRTQLLKIGAQVKVSVRRIWISMAGGFPYRTAFERIYTALRC